MREKDSKYQAVVIGTSAGGLDALAQVLPVLPANFPIPVLIVLHISPNSDSFLVEYLNNRCQVRVKEAEEKEFLQPGTVYFAPPDYHLLVEEDRSLSISNSEKVNYSRPSIDVLFETASWAFGKNLIAVLMTGANWDGAQGMKLIKESGGYTICEDPKTAAVARMPESAIELMHPDAILKLEKIGPHLVDLIS